MVSAVVLSKTWVELGADSARARLDAVFPGKFLPPRSEGTFVIEGAVPGGQLLVNSSIADAAGTFFLHSVPTPYAEVSDFAEHIVDEQLRTLALAQEAWLSVDLIDTNADPDGARRFICKTLAALAPADAAVLVRAGDNKSQRFDDALRRRMASGVWGGPFDV